MPNKVMIDGMQEDPCPLYNNVKEMTGTPKLSMRSSAREQRVKGTLLVPGTESGTVATEKICQLLKK